VRSFTDFSGLTGEDFKAFRLEDTSKPGSSNLPVGWNTPQPLLEPLTERELEVLALIAAGFSNPEIAARLYLSVNTMRAHTSNIFRKLDVHNRVQAAARGRELGLLPD
jgi:DNA-binding NarL/FixJ family response regulator